MQIFETTLHYRMVRMGDSDRLTKPALFVEYMTGAFTDCADTESLWLISMNPKCRPISRTALRVGPLAAAVTLTRDLFKVALLADANAIALVRGEPGKDVSLTKHDESLIKRIAEAAEKLGVSFVDYLVVSTCDDLPRPEFFAWRAGRA